MKKRPLFPIIATVCSSERPLGKAVSGHRRKFAQSLRADVSCFPRCRPRRLHKFETHKIQLDSRTSGRGTSRRHRHANQNDRPSAFQAHREYSATPRPFGRSWHNASGTSLHGAPHCGTTSTTQTQTSCKFNPSTPPRKPDAAILVIILLPLKSIIITSWTTSRNSCMIILGPLHTNKSPHK